MNEFWKGLVGKKVIVVQACGIIFSGILDDIKDNSLLFTDVSFIYPQIPTKLGNYGIMVNQFAGFGF